MPMRSANPTARIDGRVRLLLATLALATAIGSQAGVATSTATQPAGALPAQRATIPLGCPSDFDPSGRTSFRLKVLKWCAFPAVRGQAQIKLQISITNTSSRTLDISRPRIRLVLDHFNPSGWSPPRVGMATTERPMKVSYKGRRYWTVPPNAERAYDPIPGTRVATFATHWNVFTLAPGKTFHPVNHRTGAVVFYFSLGSRPARERDGVVGVAYMVGRSIKLLCRVDNWGPEVLAGDF
jgi:hypothetical protein